MTSIIVVLIAGLIAISEKVVSKKPSLKEYFDKVAPYQDYIGVVLLFWGIFSLVSTITSLGSLSVVAIAIYLLVAIVELGLGIILSYDLVAEHLLSKLGRKAQKRAESIHAHTLTYKTILGYVAIALAILSLITWFM